jgi:ubiquinone/menaquinone biosynthesis C-methylase UbiE
MATGYDNTTWFYERLSKLIFGQAQIKAQEYYLSQIKPGWHILIIGGGTGEILESLTRLHPSGLSITYIEVSAKMMALSQKRNTGNNSMVYITKGIEQAEVPDLYDVVITAFLFDNFSEVNLAAAFTKIDQHLKTGGLWLNTDFQLTGPLWQKVMLKSMYLLFNVLGAIDVTGLPDVEKQLLRHNYVKKGEKTNYKKFISTKYYQKL